MTEVDRILRLEVPIIVRLGQQTITMREAVSLVPGSIIELAKTAEEELDLLVNNKQIGTGAAVKVGENFGLRVTYIGDVRLRIQALGGVGHFADSAEEDFEAMAAMLGGA